MASQYYQQALEYDNTNQPHAFFHLDRMQFEGHDGLGKDEQKDLEFFKKALQFGDSEAAEYDKEMNNNQNN